MSDFVRPSGWLVLSILCALADLCGTAGAAAESDGSPCQPQWVSMFSGPNALNGPVYALLIHDFGDGPALYVGGKFTMAGNQVVNNIAKWNLKTGGWSPLGQGIGGNFNKVYCLAVYHDLLNGPQLHAGGDFPGVVRKWNGTQWESIGDGSLIYEATSLVTYHNFNGTALYIGGYFEIENQAHSLVKWDGNVLTTANVGFGNKGGGVSSSVVHNDGTGSALYICGNFDGSAFSKGNGLQWTSLWPWGAGTVTALAVLDVGTGPSLFAGCNVAQGGSYLAAGVAKWENGSWLQLGTGFGESCFAESCVGHCNTQAPGGCYCDQACCSFLDCCPDATMICNVCYGGVGGSCSVDALAAFNDGTGRAIYAAGQFGSIGNVEVSNIARWKNNQWSAVNEGISQANPPFIAVRAFSAYQPTNGDPPILFAGGNFTNTVVGDNYLAAQPVRHAPPPTSTAMAA
jgi:hypothetical protein